jgi:hypothetical protein
MELSLPFKSVAEARAYLETFRFGGRRVEQVILNGGPVIELRTCTDEEAIDIATEFYRLELGVREIH